MSATELLILQAHAQQKDRQLCYASRKCIADKQGKPGNKTSGLNIDAPFFSKKNIDAPQKSN